MQHNLYSTLLTEMKNGSKCVLLTWLHFDSSQNGLVTEKTLLTSDNIEKSALPYGNELYEKMLSVLNTGLLQMVHLAQHEAVLVEPFIPSPRLVIFGGGHIAKPLSEFAARVGFSVVVIDDRPFFANANRFPQAGKVICESFESSVSAINPRKTDFVVIITRGHRHDGVVLRDILKHNVSYIGMIGSKRRVKCMWDELISEGFSVEKLNSVNAPIGLDICAVTPDEIAISIVSQLIHCKNKSIMSQQGKAFSFPEFDAGVAERLCEEAPMPSALVTVLSTKGSVPRKAGAKMLVSYDGCTYGSIGGGCSEAGVISMARTIMLEKGFRIAHIDLTGAAAEDDGMVCGGLMDVFIEAL